MIKQQTLTDNNITLSLGYQNEVPLLWAHKFGNSTLLVTKWNHRWQVWFKNAFGSGVFYNLHVISWSTFLYHNSKQIPRYFNMMNTPLKDLATLLQLSAGWKVGAFDKGLQAVCIYPVHTNNYSSWLRALKTILRLYNLFDDDPKLLRDSEKY